MTDAVTSDNPVSGHPASVETVEAVVRRQLSQALGGRRGMVEAAVPTITFTILWLTTRELQLALAVSLSAAVLLLVITVAWGVVARRRLRRDS